MQSAMSSQIMEPIKHLEFLIMGSLNYPHNCQHLEQWIMTGKVSRWGKLHEDVTFHLGYQTWVEVYQEEGKGRELEVNEVKWCLRNCE